MTDEEQQMLKSALLNSVALIWYKDNCTCKIVKSIAKHWDEPGLVAYFWDDEYVALYNVELGDFKRMVPILD